MFDCISFVLFYIVNSYINCNRVIWDTDFVAIESHPPTGCPIIGKQNTQGNRPKFHNVVCWIPGYTWRDVNGFSEEDVAAYQLVIEALSYLILRFSEEGD